MKKKIKISFFKLLPQKFDMNGSYFCRPRYDKQNETNPRSVGQKLRSELGVEKSTHFGGFFGVGGKGGGI